ncbi:unnamed protein product [Didymodactylos carnosus]|uniref:Uncharacterized protein n=1 Tax=Didymodactylos carnosus TaxID=1234261 RepID=A0A8S2N356_9BILA|nr:unnamed protein product [Didymodactylos carnosus]CAF3985220.1 unnamed protein product [Didymodactylos carnosus]
MFDKMTVYRGLTLPTTVIGQLKQSVGKYISTNEFLSTSLYHNVAEMSVQIYNTDEDEFLFDHGAIFQIRNIRYENNKYIVSMNGINNNNIECLKSDYFQIERQYLHGNMINNILSDINANSFFGKYLLKIDSNEKAITYFEELLNNVLSNSNNMKINEYEIYLVSGNLADAYTSNEQYDLALKYAFNTYDIYRNFKYNYSVSIAVSLMRISDIYLNLDQVQFALDYIEEAFRNVSANESSEIIDYTIE